MTLIIRCILLIVIVYTLLKCMILKTFVKNSIVLLNIIKADIINKTENAKIVFELKDYLVF